MEAEIANVVEPLPDSLSGELGLGTLPALIRRLHEDRRSGILHIGRGGLERRVYFKWGEVIFANSDRTEDRLDKRLAREHGVSPDQLEQAHQTQKQSGKRFGETLVELGILDEEELLARVEEQVREIVTFLFSLDRGSYRFEQLEDPVAADLMLDLPMNGIIQDGVRSMTDPIALRIGVGSMRDYLHIGRGITSQVVSVNPSEAFVLSRVDGSTTIVDLLSVSSMDELETLRSICALLAVGMVEAHPEPFRALDLEPEPEPDELVGEERALPDPTPELPLEPEPEPRPESRPQPTVDVVARSGHNSSRKQPEAAPKARLQLTVEQKRQAAAKSYLEARRLFLDKHYHEAISALEEVVRLDPDEAPYHRLLGRACAKNPRWRPNAVEHLQKAIELDAFDARSHWFLGELFEEMGNRSEAKKMYRQVLGLDPNHKGAQDKLASSGGVLAGLKSLFKRKTRP